MSLRKPQLRFFWILQMPKVKTNCSFWIIAHFYIFGPNDYSLDSCTILFDVFYILSIIFHGRGNLKIKSTMLLDMESHLLFHSYSFFFSPTLFFHSCSFIWDQDKPWNTSYFVSSVVSQCWFVNYLLSRYRQELKVSMSN